MNPSITIERKRIDCNSLPKGWQREEVLRKSGLSAGKVDVFYYSPAGKKVESKPQLARQLGDVIDLSTFDFQTGNIIQNLSPPSISLYRCGGKGGGGNGGASVPITSGSALTATTFIGGGTTTTSSSSSSNSTNNAASNALKRKYKTQPDTGNTATTPATPTPTPLPPSSSSSINSTNLGTTTTNIRQQLEYSRALRTDISLVPPIRQTASIFKQPVTVVRNHENTKVKNDPKHGNQEKPKQLFWEKRLEGLKACHITGEEFDSIGLPKGIKSVGPNVDEQTVLQSLATALHVLNAPVTGQCAPKSNLNSNSQAFLNPDQPLMESIIISEEDIRRQEERVNAARRKLQEALKV